jgi:hypothetical protein
MMSGAEVFSSDADVLCYMIMYKFVACIDMKGWCVALWLDRGAYEPAERFPDLIFLKDLSFRTMDLKHATRVVQEMKVLRSSVMQRDKERAERATLVQQEKLIIGKVMGEGRTCSNLVVAHMSPGVPHIKKNYEIHRNTHGKALKVSRRRNVRYT